MAGSIWSMDMENMDKDLVGKTVWWFFLIWEKLGGGNFFSQVLDNSGGSNWWQTWSSTNAWYASSIFKTKKFAKNAHASPAFLTLVFFVVFVLCLISR